MSIRNGLFSSESVSEGHPDKLADRISDAVLDEFLRRDPSARVACETLLADQCVVVAGEFRTQRIEDFRIVRENTVRLVRKVLQDAGYKDSATGIDPWPATSRGTARCWVKEGTFWNVMRFALPPSQSAVR